MLTAFVFAFSLAPSGLTLTAKAPGLCEISVGAAQLRLPVGCARLRPRKAIKPLLSLDWRTDSRVERYFLRPIGAKLVVVLRREVFLESLPLEESGDTLYERARITPGPVVNGLPSLVEVRESRSRPFNQVDRVGRDVEVTKTTFVFDGSVYAPLPADP